MSDDLPEDQTEPESAVLSAWNGKVTQVAFFQTYAAF